MSEQQPHPAIGLFAIVIVHIPLAAYAWHVARGMSPTQSITTLPISTLSILTVLLLLPYIAMRRLGIRWNPPQARLNEPLD